MRTPSIPYMGNKDAIAESIVNFIRIKQPKAKYFYDLFGGGGGISTQALKQGFNVHYNEIQPRIFNLFEFLLNTDTIPPSWWDWISRDDFFKIIKSNHTDAYSGMVQQCWSFGNNQSDYLFGRKVEKIKEQLHYLVVNQSEQAKNILLEEYGLNLDIPKLPKVYDRYLKEYKAMLKNLKRRIQLEQPERIQQLQQLQRLEHLERLQRLEQLQHLENLQRLEQLQRLEHSGNIIICSNLSYKDVAIKTPIEQTVVYCDIPYQNVTGYASEMFNRQEFDKWFSENKYSCFLSEYQSDFQEVFSVDKRVTLSASNNSLVKREKLFWNRGAK